MYNILYYNMYWLCMIATIPLSTGNKLNCFIMQCRGNVSNCLALCVVVVLFCVFFVDFYVLINHLKKILKIGQINMII